MNDILKYKFKNRAKKVQQNLREYDKEITDYFYIFLCIYLAHEGVKLEGLKRKEVMKKGINLFYVNLNNFKFIGMAKISLISHAPELLLTLGDHTFKDLEAFKSIRTIINITSDEIEDFSLNSNYEKMLKMLDDLE